MLLTTRHSQSGSCLRRRATEDDNTEYKREELDTAVCARNEYVISVVP
jgi:hypothetical protein